MDRKSFKLLVLFQVIAICLSQIAFAEEIPPEELPWEKFSINLGGFTSAVDSSARIGTSAAGIDVDFEEALGLDSSTNVFRLDGLWRISKNRKHSMDFGYYDMRRDNTKILQKEIEWNGHTYPQYTEINSYFDLEIYRVGYNYAYFMDDRINLDVGIGLFVMPLQIGISSTNWGDDEVDLTAPLPYLSLNLNFAITPKLFIKEQLKLFYLEYDEFEGRITNNTLAVEYNAWEHVGLGLALDSMLIRIQANKEDYPNVDFTGEVEYKYVGLNLYIKVIF